MADQWGQPTPRLIAAAEAAVKSIGLGFDLVLDCKNPDGLRLIDIDDYPVRDLAVPGGVSVRNVPSCIKCGKGERMRFLSDVLSFQQMSENFNQELSLASKIPTGHFNAVFEFTGRWQKDASYTKALAFDGVFITLYSIELEKLQIALSEHVKQAVPREWDPAALAKFIKKYGTHVITGVKVGGKDVIYLKQTYSSPLQNADVQKILKDVAAMRFGDACGPSINDNWKTFNEAMLDRIEHGLTFMDSSTMSIYSHKEEITFFWRRRGGSNNKNMSHEKWCQSVKIEPEVVSMTFIPISSLLSGLHGSGFLGHAINLYLRYKPPIEEYHQFLEFQVPRQWAPVFSDLPLGPERKQQDSTALQFSLMGPKLFVNSDDVHVGNKPVTGLRLYLEGKRSNCLAIHLQHLSSLPKSFQLRDELGKNESNTHDHRYFEKVQWKSFSHVCTAPVESDDDLSIVTGARFEVKVSGLKNVLFLHLQFSKVIGATVVKKPEWDGYPAMSPKSGTILSIISSTLSTGPKPPKPSDVDINSAKYPEGPPVPVQTPKLLRFVDTMEMTRGPENTPGYWVVSGARLVVDNGKISLRVKYSLLTVVLPDEEVQLQG